MQVTHRASIPRLAVSPRFVVVCKQWVRTIDERFSGRTARIFYVGAIHPKQA